MKQVDFNKLSNPNVPEPGTSDVEKTALSGELEFLPTKNLK